MAKSVNMPEGPECLRTARILNEKLQGKTIIGFSLNETSRYFKTGIIAGAQYLQGTMTVVGVTSRGKKIIFHIQREDGSMINLISFLALAGRWQYTRGKHSGFSLTLGYIKELPRHKLRVTTGHIYYEDQRHQGTLQFVATKAEFDWAFKDIGPDLLQDKVTLDQYREKIRSKRISQWDVCKFMMEQKKFSSIGNYLKAEVLYEAKIAPYRTLSSLSDDDIAQLFMWSLQKPRESLEKGGLTIATYRDPDGVIGTFAPKVYKQTVDPFGNEVITQQFGDGRTTHWCPAVQK